MKLSETTGQEFNRVGPWLGTLSHLVDLSLGEILKVGVGGHDDRRKPDRMFVIGAWDGIWCRQGHRKSDCLSIQ